MESPSSLLRVEGTRTHTPRATRPQPIRSAPHPDAGTHLVLYGPSVGISRNTRIITPKLMKQSAPSNPVEPIRRPPLRWLDKMAPVALDHALSLSAACPANRCQ